MEIGASASQIFGSSSVDSVFSAGQSAPATQEQETARITIDAQRREINRLRGYKLSLTPAEKNRLTEIQVEIQEIETKASSGTVRNDELDDRTALLAEADEIIGKPTVDIEADEFLAELAGILEALLAPKLNPVVEKRVEQLERVKATVEEALNANNTDTLRAQFQNITAQIEALTPPRAVSQLSSTERRAYDDLAILINDHVGAKLQLNSRETIRVAELESSIINLQGLLAPDITQQPTPQAVARAYTRF